VKKGNLQNTIYNLGSNLGATRVVMALSIARLGDAIGNSILIIVIPLYVAALPAPLLPFPEPVRVGILISLYGIVNAFLQPLMGALSDRMGRRKLFIFLGLVLMGVATVGFIPATQFLDLLFLRAVQGVGVAVTVPAAMALMADASPPNLRGSAMGIYTTMRMVGFGAGPLLGGYLIEASGFETSFLTGAFFILLGIIAVLLWVKEIRPKVVPKSDVKFRVFDRKLINIGLVGAGIATFMMASDFSMIATLETQFNARLNETAFSFGLAYSALIISRLIFQIPLGRLSDRWGRKPFIIAGLIFIAPATLLLGLVTTTSQFIVVRIFQGAASAAIAAPAFALAADFSHAGGEGRQMSLVTMGFGLGIALGPLLAGGLVLYSFLLPFIIAAILSIIVALFVLKYVPEGLKRQNTKTSEHTEDQSMHA
jgi:MFS family permease